MYNLLRSIFNNSCLCAIYHFIILILEAVWDANSVQLHYPSPTSLLIWRTEITVAQSVYESLRWDFENNLMMTQDPKIQIHLVYLLQQSVLKRMCCAGDSKKRKMSIILSFQHCNHKIAVLVFQVSVVDHWITLSSNNYVTCFSWIKSYIGVVKKFRKKPM